MESKMTFLALPSSRPHLGSLGYRIPGAPRLA